MSSDEDDIELPFVEADSNDEESNGMLSNSDSMDELSSDLSISSIDDLLDYDDRKSQTDLTDIYEEYKENITLSLRDLIRVSCLRYGMPTYKFQLYNWKRHKVSATRYSYTDGDQSKRKRSSPIARSGHRMIFHDGRLYAFGGYNPSHSDSEPLFREMWEYNIATRCWKEIEMHGTIPQNLASHTACVVDDNESATSRSAKMLVYGGTGTPFGINMSRGVFLCDLHGGFRWSRFKIRAVQDVHITDGELAEITFSDDDEERMDSNDNHPHLPRPLYGQAIAIVNDAESGPQLYTIGGTSGFDYFIDVDRLLFRNRRWEACYRSQHDYNRLSGNEPDRRYRHELAVRNGIIYVLGGGTSFKVHGFYEIWAFNTKMKNQQPQSLWSRAGHPELEPSPTSKNGSQMGRGGWTKRRALPDSCQKSDCQYPTARRCHGLVQRGKYAYIFGGYDGKDIFGDLWRLNLDTLEWQRLPNDMAEPAYFKGTAITPRGQLFTFGGVTSIEQERSDKIHSLWLDIPSLREIAWQAIQHYLPGIEKVGVKTLRESGVPIDLIESIQDESSQQIPAPNQPDVG